MLTACLRQRPPTIRGARLGATKSLDTLRGLIIGENIALSVLGAAPRCGEMKIVGRCGSGAWLRSPWPGLTLKGCLRRPRPTLLPGSTSLERAGLEGIP